tara:strand:- start:557 stop:982 length:426 start_codon:yes stop_codon:yes gene_type:complete
MNSPTSVHTPDHTPVQPIEVNQVDKDVLKSNVTKYLDIDRQIKEKQKEMKILRDMKKSLEGSIIEFMKDKDIPQIQFKDGERLQLRETISKKSISDKWLDEKFNFILSTSDSGELKDALETLRMDISQREATTRESLKHSK